MVAQTGSPTTKKATFWRIAGSNIKSSACCSTRSLSATVMEQPYNCSSRSLSTTPRTDVYASKKTRSHCLTSLRPLTVMSSSSPSPRPIMYKTMVLVEISGQTRTELTTGKEDQSHRRNKNVRCRTDELNVSNRRHAARVHPLRARRFGTKPFAMQLACISLALAMTKVRRKV